MRSFEDKSRGSTMDACSRTRKPPRIYLTEEQKSYDRVARSSRAAEVKLTAMTGAARDCA